MSKLVNSSYRHGPLVRGVLRRRYKRFLSDVLVDGEEHTAHCANPGPCAGILDLPNSDALLTRSDNPKRKTAYTLEYVLRSGVWINVNTHLPNKVVWEALRRHHLPLPFDYDVASVRKEVAYQSCRFDFSVVTLEGKTVYVEVKNVTHSELVDGQKVALFPDCVTKRGQRQLAQLIDIVKREEAIACLLYYTSLTNCAFAPATHLDRTYSDLVVEAVAAGVHVVPIVFSPRTEEAEELFFDLSVQKTLPLVRLS